MRTSKIKEIREKNHQVRNEFNRVVKDMDRVSNVLENIDDVVADLDTEFANKTGILNSTDMSFLFVAVMLQSLRWVLMPELNLPNLDDKPLTVDKEDRMGQNEKNHKGGPYDGQSSGAMYESEELKKYREKHQKKFQASEDEYYKKKSTYKTFAEIVTQPVPYDAMNACDKTLIPNIGGFNNLKENGNYSNIYAKNHHVATLGHDPILGWIFGTANIMSNTITMMTFQSFSVIRGNSVKATNLFIKSEKLQFSGQEIDYGRPWLIPEILEYCYNSILEDSKRLPAAVVRHGIHLASDKYCVEGLPIPFLSTIDPQKAQELIEKGYNNEELKVLLKGDLMKIGFSALLSLLINLILESIYLFCVDTEGDIDIKKVRIKKILLLSNTITSTSNILYVAITKKVAKLDIGGIGITLLNLFKTPKFIDEIKQEYIANGIADRIMGNETWIDIATKEKYENEQ